MKKQFPSSRPFFPVFLFVFICLMPMKSLRAQDYVTGAFEGLVKNSVTGEVVPGATVQIINNDTGVPIARQTDSQGRFRQALLPPGDYTVRVSKQGFLSYESQQSLPPMKATTVVPVPVNLKPEAPTPVATPTPSEAVAPTVNEPSKPPVSPTPTPEVQRSAERTSILSEINTTDAQRGDTFGEKEVSTLPLGGVSLTRSFDELGLLLPGVALPPMTEGGGSGPGVGAGVGSSGQFAVNGLRSRANNFTVDGSDNNDEDIGVRRQGFFALVPQPIESIQVYQVITLLAPAQYGRNFGAQVNAVSKSGGNQFHGVLFGFLNSDRLNSRNFFDTNNGNATTALRSSTGQAVLDCTGVSSAACITRNRPITTTNQSDGEDSFTLGQGGFVLGGPIKKDKAFFFVSYEKQVLNASKEASFAVPTVDRRGIFNTGATGIFADCTTGLPGFNITNCTPANRANFFPEFGYPTAAAGDAVFSLFPFANNPNGVYGANTYTESLPASARGDIASGKYNQNFELRGKPQTFTARYNFTQDRRDIPVTGGALFSSLRPRVRTQNLSTFLTSQLTNSISNVLSLSYGRTRLAFDELRNPFLLKSQVSPNEKFLLNAPLVQNNTLNPQPVNFVGVPNTGPVLYSTNGTTECGFSGAACSATNSLGGLGRVGQVNIAGFSPIGVDVNNFPQNRVNNTYQISDVLGYQRGKHSFAFGTDIRRVELNSALPRNSRTLLSYQGAPEFDNANSATVFTGNFIPGIDFAAAGAPSGAFLSLSRVGTNSISLRYHEFNFFGQDTWRIRQNLSLNFGVRYEYNTPAKETHNLIERTFSDALLNDPNAVGLKKYIAGRTGIFDASRTNFAPRFGLAWSPNWFGQDHTSVIRAGFGLFYDQILGAVVSQSRNVFPNFITVNTGGFHTRIDPIYGLNILDYFNPALGGVFSGGVFTPLVQPGTLNTLNPALSPATWLNVFAGGAFFPNGVSVTLPDRGIKPPSAEHYSVSFEQQLNANLVLSAGYVGTRGHSLLRASTPNLGPNNLIIPIFILAGFDSPNFTIPAFTGTSISPFNPAVGLGRPTAGAGPIFLYESGGGSRYNALQLQVRGRFSRSLQFQAAYTYSKAKDDASDVFDLAGSPALPQNSLTRKGEFGPSNFDATNRFAYNLVYDFPITDSSSDAYKAIFGGLQFASTGYLQTGQPFTVNTVFDVNLDGNLTDRLNSTAGLLPTRDRRQPIAIGSSFNLATLLARPGENGSVGRNTFRAGSVINLDLAMVKNFSLTETKRIVFRADVFNFINRANFGIPVRFLEAPGFGQATDTVTPARRIQLGLKLIF